MRTAAVVAVLFAATGCGGGPGQLVLPRDPYLGVACREPARTCTRVGLGVWTPWHARRVAATVGRNRFALFTRPGRGAYGKGRFWQGFFSDASVAARADRHGRARVSVTAVDAAGKERTAVVDVPVSPGYG